MAPNPLIEGKPFLSLSYIKPETTNTCLCDTSCQPRLIITLPDIVLLLFALCVHCVATDNLMHFDSK